MTWHHPRAALRLTSIVVRASALVSSMLLSACGEKAPATPTVIDVRSSDSVVLKATLFAAAKPGPAVIMLHQCDEQRKVWDSLGVKLMNAGISAMSVDYRGYGESGGVPHEKLTPQEANRLVAEQWPVDIDSAYALLLRQPNVDSTRIGIAGGSCGVENAVQLARRKHGIKALTLLAGGAAHDGRLYIAAAGAPPVFVGAAADDKYANFVEIMGWMFSLSPNKQSRIIEYADGGHAAVVFNKHPAFADSIAKWFSAVLMDKPELLPTTNGKPMDQAVAKVLDELDQPGGAELVAQKLSAARTKDSKAQLFPEYYANALGYEHAQAGDHAGAIAIMKLNTLAYPASPNAMDSLGDIYAAAGDRKNAVEAAKRALILLETDTTDTEQRKDEIRSSAVAKLKAP